MNNLEKFQKLPRNIILKIITKVKFNPSIKFEKNTCIENKNDSQLYYINGKIKYNKLERKWEYLCDHRNKRLESIYLSEDKINIKEYFEVSCCEPGGPNLQDGRNRKTVCKDCDNILCSNCYQKSKQDIYGYRGLCNTCIWFDLG